MTPTMTTPAAEPSTYTNYAGKFTQQIDRPRIGGQLVAAVAFEHFDGGVSVEVVVPWQRALEYLRNTGRSVTRVFWLNAQPQGAQDFGNNGWSWASWRRSSWSGLYFISSLGGDAMLREVKVEGIDPKGPR